LPPTSTTASTLDPTQSFVWPFVGRACELRALRRALGGRGAVLVGPAGSGTSALARHVVTAPAAVVVATPASEHLANWGIDSLAGTAGTCSLAPADLARSIESRHRGSGPPVIVIDNIDHLDRESLATVTRLAADGRIRLVATRRSTRVPTDAVAALWRDLGLTRIDVGALSEDEVHELLRSALGSAVDGRALSELTTRCDGNPLVLRGLVEQSRRDGSLVEREGLWQLVAEPTMTADVCDLARSELDGLNAASRDAVEILAIGEALPLGLATAVVDPLVLEGLERRGLVRVDRHDTVTIASPVVAAVAHREIPRLGRRRLAGVLADAADALDPGDGLELRRVVWLVDAGRAVPAGRLLGAARSAVEAGDPLLAERLAACSTEAGPSTEAALLESWCADERGDIERATAVLEAHHPDTDEAVIATAVRRAEQHFWARHDPVEAARILADAAAEVREPWPRAAAAQQCVFDGLDGRCDEVLDRVPLLVDDPEHLVGSTAALAATFSLVATDRADEAIQVANEALARLAGPVPPLYLDPGVHIIGLGFALHGAGELVAADELTAEVYRHALARPGRQAQGWAAMLRAHVLTARGRPAEAVEAALEAEAVWARAHLDGPARWSATLAALAHAELGEARELAASLSRVDRYEPAPFRLFEPETRRARAWLNHVEGTGDPAVDFVEAAAEAGSSGRSALAAAAAHDLIRIGHPESAAAILDALPTGGRVTGLRRSLATATAARDGAALVAVADRFDEMGAAGWAAEARALAAPHLPAQAAALRHDAARVANRTGLATPPLRRHGAQPTERALTAREAEVVGLAASGLSNRAIADQLVVSLRTVENHLHRSFAKLGVASRSELAGVWAGRG
jgi:DNA-binding CsgD family transcriptional regulator